MNLIEDQFEKIINDFPNAIIVDNIISHIKIPIINENLIEIDFKNYPKKPKVSLINQKGQEFKRLDKTLTTLSLWKIKNAPSIIELIDEIINLIKNLTLNEIIIKKELLDGILALCREHHPKELLGLLRVENEIVTEFILPPGALSSSSSGVFFPSRIPLDFSLQGTVHSHPSGNPYPSSQDLKSIFKKMRFHFIVGYPYNIMNTKCYDRNGRRLNFKVIN